MGKKEFSIRTRNQDINRDHNMNLFVGIKQKKTHPANPGGLRGCIWIIVLFDAEDG